MPWHPLAAHETEFGCSVHFKEGALRAAQEWDAAVANQMPAWLWALAKRLALLAGPAAPADAVPPWGGSRWLLDPGRTGPTSLDPLLG